MSGTGTAAIIDHQTWKHLVGSIAIVLCFVQYVPLLIATLRQHKQPHAFSRLIWGLCLGIVGVGQFVAGGGSGAWPTLTSAVFCLAIGFVALRTGRTYITRSDWFFATAALLAIPVWLLTHDPLVAVIWATLIDVLGYAPTFRKSWKRPNDEMVGSFVLGCIKAVLGITALQAYSWTTLIAPGTLLTLDIAFIAMTLVRSRILSSL